VALFYSLRYKTLVAYLKDYNSDFPYGPRGRKYFYRRAGNEMLKNVF